MKSVWSKLGFTLVNAWLVYHIFCIFAGPASVYPSSRLEQRGWELASGYLQTLYFNHGWHYFSPQPGGATLIDLEIGYEDGRKETFRFPNRSIQPRLLYHRYFMISEHVGSLPPIQQRQFAYALAGKLCLQDGARKVTVHRVYHELSSRERILAGGKLNDPQTYRRELLGVYRQEQFLRDQARPSRGRGA